MASTQPGIVDEDLHLHGGDRERQVHDDDAHLDSRFSYREPGSTEWRYPAWQFENGKPRQGVARVVAAARDRGLDDAKLYGVLTTPLGLRDGGRTLVELLLEGREDEVVAAVRAS